MVRICLDVLLRRKTEIQIPEQILKISSRWCSITKIAELTYTTDVRDKMNYYLILIISNGIYAMNCVTTKHENIFYLYGLFMIRNHLKYYKSLT